MYLESEETKYEKAREEIENLETQIQSYHNDNPMISQAEVLEILDNLIAESEVDDGKEKRFS